MMVIGEKVELNVVSDAERTAATTVDYIPTVGKLTSASKLTPL
jgi:hypothetical protein